MTKSKNIYILGDIIFSFILSIIADEICLYFWPAWEEIQCSTAGYLNETI